VFRLKAEGYKTSRKGRIKPFKTFSVFTTYGLSLKALSLQPSVYLPEELKFLPSNNKSPMVWQCLFGAPLLVGLSL
jgi:hypothetical protein